MNVAFSLDWLRVTFPVKSSDPTNDYGLAELGELTEARGKLTYNTTAQNELYSLSWHTEHPDMRVMFEMTGKQLSDYRICGGDAQDMLYEVIAMNCRFTRIDFAVDIFDCEGCPTDFSHCFDTNQVDTLAKSITTIEGKTLCETLGATVYLGSRHSERMVRVYDKGKEIGTRLDWIRVEMESKKKRADQLGYMMARGSIKEAGMAYLTDFIPWTDVTWYEEALSGHFVEIDIDAIGRPETDHDQWIREVCIPNIARSVESGMAGVVAALEAILAENNDRKKHGPSLVRRGK